jgi:type II secretory pathway component PulF
MPTYWYKALGAENRPTQGTIIAASRREALQRLMDSGQHPLDLSERRVEDAAGTAGFQFGRQPIRLAILTRQLATLSASGVPIVKSLNVLMEQLNDPRARRILTDIRESVRGGSTFADALGKHPRVFPKLMISMVRVGEMGGTLDEELLELSELYEKEEARKGEVRAAIAYPVLVLFLGVASAVVLVAFLIPRLEELFKDVGQDLPVPTLVLLAISHFVTTYRWKLAVAILAAIGAFKLAVRNSEVRLFIDRYKLRIPWLGTLVRNLEIERFARLLGTLTHGGITIVEALDIVEPAVSNEAIAATVRSMTKRIRTGESLAALMKETDVFPPLPVQMVAVGEETGHLDQMLLRVAEAYDRETTTSTKVMTSLLAPAMILFVAGIVGFILISMMLPIFQLSTVIR